MGHIISHLTLDQERSLYGLRGALVQHCQFSGPGDGESALKECRDIAVEDCVFHLRYPLWHAENAQVRRIHMSEGCRAAMWYDRGLHVSDSTLDGIKAFRECSGSSLTRCQVRSREFGWCCREITVEQCRIESEYPFFQCRGLTIRALELVGKYSFQYCTDVTIRNAHLDTKDAFWHGRNVTIYDSVVKGEYLGWYSENLRLVRCRIIGTQPLCYCKNLVLEDCTMEDTDLAFENSTVEASVCGHILSVKNPAGGSIVADSIGEVLCDQYQWTTLPTRIHQRFGKP